MYFLDGNRLYIKPDTAGGSFEGQLENCLVQLKDINSAKKIFKLNFFVDTSSESRYSELVLHIKQKVATTFTEDIIQNFIAQPPLTCRIIVEAFYYDAEQWEGRYVTHENDSAMLFRKEKSEILIGNVQANFNEGCRKNAELVFANLSEILRKVNFPVNSIIRQWNYVEGILGFDGDQQHYQEFNNVRSQFYQNHFAETGFPAATGIGMNRGGVIVEFVAVKSDEAQSRPVDHPFCRICGR